ncbi:MAG: hypothetical protein WA895_02470 [Streptosporangiaceae bacterium]|jgi:hypothetical protein
MIFEKVMTVVPDGEASSRSPDAGRSDRSDMPVLPAQSQEDTDVGWGEQPEPEDDERLHRERPPHWDSL